ncbi:MAG TPA: ABC transporter ATP-binding protein [Chthonomonadales bacterium]|nr:ABC transporter ATP-binding protein [Chthonomonadales bacterium]
MPEPVVQVESVYKKYCRSLKKGMLYSVTDISRDTLGIPTRSDRLRPGEFFSVKDVSFDLYPGDCLGLIGENGAGKSTLLKMLNGIIRPDAGTIRMKGRIGALIEVGAGFHPMLSGRENVYVNGAILGMSAREITRKFDSIVEFSRLSSDVLDAPIKTYSSGMYVRLGFAVAVHCEPDILLVDEVLAVGDISFVSSCYKRLQELMRSGTTVILVSHSLPRIDAFCNRALLMKNGAVIESGPTRAVTTSYRQLLFNTATVKDRPAFKATGVCVTSVRVVDDRGADCTLVPWGEERTVVFDVQAREPLRHGGITVFLQRQVDRLMASSAYVSVGEEITQLTSGTYRLRMPMLGSPGPYELAVAVTGESRAERYSEVYAMPFTITSAPGAPEPAAGDITQGVCNVPVEVEVDTSAADFAAASARAGS